MWIRASYTVENAVIVPVFSMIIILIISFTCNIHDEIIKENVMSQIGIENELSEMNSDRRNDFEKIAEEYLTSDARIPSIIASLQFEYLYSHQPQDSH